MCLCHCLRNTICNAARYITLMMDRTYSFDRLGLMEVIRERLQFIRRHEFYQCYPFLDTVLTIAIVLMVHLWFRCSLLSRGTSDYIEQ